MNRLRQVFDVRHVVLPVVHVEDEAQALRNTQIARDAGADGVFLINHAIEHEELLRIHARVIAAFPDWWVGINCLDLSPVDTFKRISNEVSGVWVDHAMIHEEQDTQPDAERVKAVQSETGWEGLYFGGVAFKYQRPVEDLTHAARIACNHMDVVTTSGPGTGLAALPEKISTMKQGMGDHPLAIASGITPENVMDYLPSAGCFLVATGISKSFGDFDAERVEELVHRVRSYRSPESS